MKSRAESANDRKKAGFAKTISLIAGLTGIPSTNRDKRGFDAEEKALKAARHWVGKKIIREAKKSRRLSLEDMAGEDLTLTLLNNKRVKVQVKNYCDYLVMKKCRVAGIRPFIVWPDDGEEIAEERMLNLVISAYIAELSPLQIRQVVACILKIKQPKKSNFMRRILSPFRKAR